MYFQQRNSRRGLPEVEAWSERGKQSEFLISEDELGLLPGSKRFLKSFSFRSRAGRAAPAMRLKAPKSREIWTCSQESMRFRALLAHIWIYFILYFTMLKLRAQNKLRHPYFLWGAFAFGNIYHITIIRYILYIFYISFNFHWPGDHYCKVQGVCTAWVNRRLLLSGSIFSTLLCIQIQGFNFNCAKVPSRWINRRNKRLASGEHFFENMFHVNSCHRLT